MCSVFFYEKTGLITYVTGYFAQRKGTDLFFKQTYFNTWAAPRSTERKFGKFAVVPERIRLFLINYMRHNYIIPRKSFSF